MITKRFVIGAITTMAVLFGAAFLLRPALAGSLSALQQETAMPLSSRLAEVWSQFCVVTKQMSYVLLAIPEDATFEIVSPEGAVSSQGTASTPEPGTTSTPESSIAATPSASSGTVITNGEASCQILGTTDGEQLVLCTGPATQVITLSITSGGQTEEFPIMPPGCAAGFPGPTEPLPTETEIIIPTVPILPTESPEPSPSPVPPTPPTP